MGLRPVNKEEGLHSKSLVILLFENADFGLLLQAEGWSRIHEPRNDDWAQKKAV